MWGLEEIQKMEKEALLKTRLEGVVVYAYKNQYTALLLNDNAVYEINYNEFSDVVSVCGFVCTLGDLDWKKLNECCKRVSFDDLPDKVKKQVIRLLEA